MKTSKPTLMVKRPNKIRVVVRDMNVGNSRSFTVVDASLEQVVSDLRAVYADEPGQTKTTQQTS